LIERPAYSQTCVLKPRPEQPFIWSAAARVAVVAEQDTIAPGKADSITMMTAKPSFVGRCSASTRQQRFERDGLAAGAFVSQMARQFAAGRRAVFGRRSRDASRLSPI